MAADLKTGAPSRLLLPVAYLINPDAAGSQPRLGLSGTQPGAEDGTAHQFSDRRPSPFTGSCDGARAARLDRSRARSCLGRIVRTTGPARRIDQDRRTVASVEQMESHLQKKRCTPASKNARTYSRRDERGRKRYRGWTSKS